MVISKYDGYKSIKFPRRRNVLRINNSCNFVFFYCRGGFVRGGCARGIPGQAAGQVVAGQAGGEPGHLENKYVPRGLVDLACIGCLTVVQLFVPSGRPHQAQPLPPFYRVAVCVRIEPHRATDAR